MGNLSQDDSMESITYTGSLDGSQAGSFGNWEDGVGGGSRQKEKQLIKPDVASKWQKF